MKRLLVLPVACVAALLVAVGAGAANGNQVLASGNVSEVVAGGDWSIQFQIHARGNGQSSLVSAQAPAYSFSFDGSSCSGSYTDPYFGGTDVFTVGKRLGYTGANGYDYPYYAYVIHEGGPLGANGSEIFAMRDASYLSLVCASPGSWLIPQFGLDAASVLFKV